MGNFTFFLFFKIDSLRALIYLNSLSSHSRTARLACNSLLRDTHEHKYKPQENSSASKQKNKTKTDDCAQVSGLSGGASYLPPGSVGGFLWPTSSNPHSTIFENSAGDPMEWLLPNIRASLATLRLRTASGGSAGSASSGASTAGSRRTLVRP